MNAPSQLSGFIGTKAGETRVDLRVEGERAKLIVTAQWMGQDPLAVVLLCRHEVTGSHAGVFILEDACGSDGTAMPLPPSDGEITIEYLHVPAQPAPHGGCEEMEVSGRWTDPYSLVLWLHRETAMDEDLDPASEPLAVALDWIHHPFKLG